MITGIPPIKQNDSSISTSLPTIFATQINKLCFHQIAARHTVLTIFSSLTAISRLKRDSSTSSTLHRISANTRN